MENLFINAETLCSDCFNIDEYFSLESHEYEVYIGNDDDSPIAVAEAAANAANSAVAQGKFVYYFENNYDSVVYVLLSSEAEFQKLVDDAEKFAEEDHDEDEDDDDSDE